MFNNIILCLTGDKCRLRRCVAPAVLYLKVGAPVMVTYNLSATVVNGSVGLVEEASAEKIMIRLNHNKLFLVTLVKFTRFDPRQRRVVASRYQFPLRVAYALTFHKSQGKNN